MRAWKGIGAVVLGAASFALGFAAASPDRMRAIDLDESGARIRSAMLTAQRLEQTQLVVPVLRAMEPADVTDLAEVFEETFADGGGGLPLELFVERWASFDPEACRERIASWPPDVRAQAWPVLIGTWSRSDPRAASEVLHQIRDRAARGRSLRPLIAGWLATDDPALWRELALAPEGELRELTDFAVQQRLRSKGSEALLAELEGLSGEPFEDFKGIALAAVLEQIAREDLPGAISLAQAYRNTPYADEVLLRIGPKWAAIDGLAAIEWLRGAPASEARDLALKRTYRRWLVRDRSAATRWIEESATPEELDLLAPEHAAALARRDPRSAVAWASAIPSEDARRRSLLEIGRIWRRADPVAANDWLASAGLLDEINRPARN